MTSVHADPQLDPDDHDPRPAVRAVDGGAPAADGAVPPEVDGVWSPARRRLTVALVLTITLVAFESLAIATVMPVVADDLGGLGLYGWVFSGFFLGNLLGIVWAGQAADRHGTRMPYAAGLVVFTAGLLVGGAARSMGMLVAGRVAQGLGAGVIPAVAYATVARAYPPGLRPRVFAVFSTAWVIPGLVGPAAASGIEHAASWRFVFIALLPFVLVAALLALPVLPNHPPLAPADGAGRADGRRLRDAAVLVGGVALVFGGLKAGAPVLVAALAGAGAVVAAWAFLRLVPPGTVRLVPGMPAAVAARGILTFAFFGTDAYVSLAVTDGHGAPTWVAGLALTGATLTWTTGAWLQERLVRRRGPRWLVRRGMAVLAVGIAATLVGLGDVPVAVIVVGWTIGGLGIGLSYAPITVTVLGAAAAGEEGAASASLQLTDVLGVAVGTGVVGAFVALGDGRGWATTSSLAIAFVVTLLVAVAGVLAAVRLPRRLPGVEDAAA
jgi:MFS family permease